MRKKKLTNHVVVLLDDESFSLVKQITEADEISISEYVRGLIEKEIAPIKMMMEESNE